MLRVTDLALQRVRSIQGNDFAAIHDSYPFTETVGFFHVMSSIENGHPPGSQTFNSFVNIVAGLGINTHRRFIQEKELEDGP